MSKQLQLDVHQELIIDNFAGGGGASTGIDASGARIPLTKTAQVRMCGNSVCPPLAAALVRANVPELAVRRIAA